MNPLIFNLLLGIGGACAGAFINWAIYNLCYDERGSISPWNAPRESASRRKLLDYIPIFGWLSLSRDDSVHGKLHWIRPLLIELTTALGAVWFYHWQMSGGLIDGGTLANPISPSELETWFAGHSLLIVLMLIATFIDFDEKTIPDWITIPGTLTALAIAAFYPAFRLPEVINNPAGLGSIHQSVTFHSNSADPMPTWHHDGRGLLTAMGIIGVWAFALLPTTPYLFRFIWKAFRHKPSRCPCVTIGFMLQPKRKTECAIRKKNRASLLPHLLLAMAIFVAAVGLAAFVFYQGNPIRWNSLFGAILGLGIGGGIVWIARIVGGVALGQEAMGFGDVTLMAMIGAFLGWQAALLTFAFAPFAAMFIALAQLIITRRNDIAFGPYLCLAALFIIICWRPVWEWGRNSFFMWGLDIFVFALPVLVLFALMLFGIQFLKSRGG